MSDETEPTGVRAWLKWYLTRDEMPLVPAKWNVIDTMTMPQVIRVPTVTVRHTRMEPYPSAPLSDNLVNDLVIRVADPNEKFETAENNLDAEVLTLIRALKDSARLKWTGAEKIQIADTPYYAWDITVQVLSTFTNP